MVMCNLLDLQERAMKFRRAIERCDRSFLPVTFEHFPHGACGDAALLLAKYLEESGLGPFNYVLGDRNGSSHAWLENGEVVVDITADQFSDMPHPVVVVRKSEWHKALSGEIQNVADFDIYDQNTRNTLRSAYSMILKHVH